MCIYVEEINTKRLKKSLCSLLICAQTRRLKILSYCGYDNHLYNHIKMSHIDSARGDSMACHVVLGY